MKKILSAVLAAVMILSLSACGNNNSGSAGNAGNGGDGGDGGSNVSSVDNSGDNNVSSNSPDSSKTLTFVMIEEPLSTEQYGIAFRKGNDALAEVVKAALDEMYEDGTFAEITETWGLSDMSCYDQAGVHTPADAETVAEIEGRTKLTLGFDAEYPPYGYMDEATGQYVGYDLDLAAEVCRRLGWELVPQPIDWDSKDMELNAGNIDLIWNGMTMTGRENEYTWVGPYVDNSIVFVVTGDSGITSKADLAGRNVITQSGSSALTALTDDPGDGSNDENLALAATFAKLEQIADYNTAFMNLESGVVDAVAVDIGVANYQLEARNG